MSTDPALRRDETRGRVRLMLTGSTDTADPGRHGELAESVGLPAERVLLLRQVHGSTVVHATQPWPGTAPDADGVLLDRAGLAAGVRGADCMPLLLADTARGVAAAVHVGRAGLVADIVGLAVRALRDAGARQLLAVPGPTVCGRCYEVPAELSSQVGAAVPGASSTTSWGTPAVDIPAGVRAQLDAAAAEHGLPLTVDDSWQECTLESAHLLSYRRDATAARHAALVQVLP